MSPEEYDRFTKEDPRTKAILEHGKDAARWRALVASTGHETDMSSGPGKPKDMIVRIDCTGCAKWLESGAVDWAGTLNAAMDDEIRLQESAPGKPAITKGNDNG